MRVRGGIELRKTRGKWGLKDMCPRCRTLTASREIFGSVYWWAQHGTGHGQSVPGVDRAQHRIPSTDRHPINIR